MNKNKNFTTLIAHIKQLDDFKILLISVKFNQ